MKKLNFLIFLILVIFSSCRSSNSENDENDNAEEYNLVKLVSKINGATTNTQTFSANDCAFKSTIKIESNNNVILNVYNENFDSGTGINKCEGTLNNYKYNPNNQTINISGIENKVTYEGNMLVLSSKSQGIDPNTQIEFYRYFNKK